MRPQTLKGVPEAVGRPTSPSASVGMAEAKASASVGIMEVQSKMHPDKHYAKIHNFISSLSAVPPQKRFDMTQTALLDMHEVVEVHASMRKRAEAEAAAAKKNKIDLEAELSQVRESHRRLENTLQMRDDALLLERERSKKLALDLAEMRQQSKENREEAARWKHQLGKSHEEIQGQFGQIDTLRKSESELLEKVSEQAQMILRLQEKLESSRQRLHQVDEDNKALSQASQTSQRAETHAWALASQARQRIVDNIDEALMSNPSHFDVFSLEAFRNRAVVVTGVARAGKTNVPDAAPQHAGRREDVAWLQEASAQ